MKFVSRWIHPALFTLTMAAATPAFADQPAPAGPEWRLSEAQIAATLAKRAADLTIGRAAGLKTAADLQANPPRLDRPGRTGLGSAALITDKGPSFYIYAAGPSVVGDWGNDTFRGNAMQTILEDFYGRPGVPQSQILLTYSTFDIGNRISAFYVPLGNDILGIGYKHQQGLNGQETFSLPPPFAAQGFVMMNQYQSYGSGTGRQGFEHYLTAMQEIGHRWGAQMQVGIAGKEKIMLGRDDSHWSFYLDTGGSPMEGNAWVDNGNGTFTTRTLSLWFGGTAPPYSNLDLYAMGLMAPSEVTPWFVIEPTGSSFPASCGPVFNCSGSDRTVTGTKRTLTLTDVINSEGVRVPATSPADLHISVLLIVPQANLPVSAATKSAVETLVQQAATFYGSATRGRGRLVLDSVNPLPALKGLGATCLSSNECDPALADQCSRSDAGDGATCVKNCGAGGACGQGYCCAGGFGTTMACFPGGSQACPDTEPPMKKGLGERCVGGDDCQSGQCIEQPGQPGYMFCTAECQNTPCGGPAGTFSCVDAGGGAKACIYAGVPPGGLGSVCAGGDECVSGMCLPLATGMQCSTLCTDTTPCPGGFDCVATAGVEKVCQLKTTPKPGGDGDGGCTVGSPTSSTSRTGALFGVLMLVAALALVTRRRT